MALFSPFKEPDESDRFGVLCMDCKIYAATTGSEAGNLVRLIHGTDEQLEKARGQSRALLEHHGFPQNPLRSYLGQVMGLAEKTEASDGR